MSPAPAQPATLWYLWMFVAGGLNCLLPLVALIVMQRRLRFAWAIPAIGALAFLVSQLILRIPALAAAQPLIGPVIAKSVPLRWTWLVLVAFSAGLFEETARWLALRYLLKGAPRTVETGVGFGLGHGGFEALMLVGLGQIASAALFLLVGTGWLDKVLPAEALAALPKQLEAIAAQPTWTPLLGLWERAGSLCVHVSLSVVVVVGLARGDRGFLLLAIALHGLSNLAVVGWVQVQGTTMLGMIGAEVIVSAFAIAGIAFVLQARRALPRPPPRSSGSSGAGGGSGAVGGDRG